MKKVSLSTPVSSSRSLPAKTLSTLCQRIANSSPASAKRWVAAQKLQASQKSIIPREPREVNKESSAVTTFAMLAAKNNPAPIPPLALALHHTSTLGDSLALEPEVCDLEIDDAYTFDPAPGTASCDIAPANADATSSSTVPVSAAASAPVLALTAARSLVSYVFKMTPQVFEMRLNSQPEDFHWMEVSSVYEHREGKVIMDSSFLKNLNVNPKIYFEKDACTPYEWCHVVLLARYYGDDIQGDTNKSIWHSVNNDTSFAIVWPAVRGRIEKCIDALQLRATKSIPIEGYGRRNGIVPVQNVKVKFSVIKHATMETLLNMPDKVR
jgi:hypothetical protein